MLADSFEAIVLSSFSFLVRNATLLCPSPGQVQARLRLCLDDIRLWRGGLATLVWLSCGVCQAIQLIKGWKGKYLDGAGCGII